MLKVKIELLPFGMTSVPSKVWIAHIWNDASGTKQIGNYLFKIFQMNSNDKVWRGGEVKNFKRKEWSVWYLLYLCLKTIYGD